MLWMPRRALPISYCTELSYRIVRDNPFEDEQTQERDHSYPAKVTVSDHADPTRYRCIGCCYVSSCMFQKTLKLDNPIEMMDRLKVPWSPNPDGDIKEVGKGGSTAADICNLRARNGDEFDTPIFILTIPARHRATRYL